MVSSIFEFGYVHHGKQVLVKNKKNAYSVDPDKNDICRVKISICETDC